MKTDIKLFIVVMIIGFFVSIGFIAKRVEERNAASVEVEAVCTDVATGRLDGEYVYYPIWTYTYEGKEYSWKQTPGADHFRSYRGRTTTLLIVPYVEPHTVYRKGADSGLMTPIVFMLFCGTMSVVAFVSGMKQKKEKELKQQGGNQ